jgi:hypothetical protein
MKSPPERLLSLIRSRNSSPFVELEASLLCPKDLFHFYPEGMVDLICRQVIKPCFPNLGEGNVKEV